jgi:hypothetical protein
MIVHCEKHEDGFFYCQELHTLRREEDRRLEHELEQGLLEMFPDQLRAVRLVREGKSKGRYQ